MQDGGTKSVLPRKGVIGDWHNHMSPLEWARFDSVLEERLGNVAVVQPFRFFQTAAADIPHPPPRSVHTIQDDPRKWPEFSRATLENGFVVRDSLIARGKPKESFSSSATFKRPAS